MPEHDSKRRKIIAVDFDGTLCENRFPQIGKARRDVIDALLDEIKQGCIVILWTCREDSALEDAVGWCMLHGILFDAVNENTPEMIKIFGNTRKVFADEYWDDRNVCIHYDPQTA